MQPMLALELFRLAASMGDPEAQGQMGVRFALGLQYLHSWGPSGIVSFGEVSCDLNGRQHPHSWGPSSIISFGEVSCDFNGMQHPHSWGPTNIVLFGRLSCGFYVLQRPHLSVQSGILFFWEISCRFSPAFCCYPTQADENAATLHFYFGSLGGDPLSRMAMGYRHQHGVGVPKSCWSAVAYYQPMGEMVCVSAGKRRETTERYRMFKTHNRWNWTMDFVPHSVG
jgi:hypothetical protein